MTKKRAECKEFNCIFFSHGSVELFTDETSQIISLLPKVGHILSSFYFINPYWFY